MCEPVTISTGAAWAMGISAAAAVAGTAVAYNAQKEQAKANAAREENNARLAADQAKDAQALGDREGEQATWRTRALIGQQRAAIGAAGIDSAIGTPAEILGETAMFGEIDQQSIRLNAARSAWGFNAQATNAQNNAKQARWGGKQQANATLLAGLGSTASAVGGFYG